MSTVSQQNEQLIALLKQIHQDLGGVSANPSTMTAGVRQADTPGQVLVTFTWDSASDGGVTDSYTLTIFDPDNVQVGLPNPVPDNATLYTSQLVDDNRLYAATLTAWNAAGQPCPVPAVATFTPHVEIPPPPPQLPANPTGFTAGVAVLAQQATSGAASARSKGQSSSKSATVSQQPMAAAAPSTAAQRVLDAMDAGIANAAADYAFHTDPLINDPVSAAGYGGIAGAYKNCKKMIINAGL